MLRRLGDTYEAFFDKAWFSYITVVLAAVDVPLCEISRKCIAMSICAVDSHSDDELTHFTKESMKLFDALRQFLDYVEPFGFAALSYRGLTEV